jgi:pilus assembly protein Flp/PilA
VALPRPGEGRLIDRENDVYLYNREEGQGLVEYGLIIALVAVLAIAGLIIFGPAISSLLSNLGSSV